MENRIRSEAWERAQAAKVAAEALADHLWDRRKMEEYQRAREASLALSQAMERLTFRV